MKEKNKILVICHDAGGAEIISAYVKASWKKNYFVCLVAGPAEKIFKRKQIPFQQISEKIDFETALTTSPKVKVVLSGISWSSPIEMNFIREAKLRGIKTIVYLDHWTNYRNRFGYPNRKWKKDLPDEIWVGDKYAKHLASKCFAELVKIRLVPNYFFKEIAKEYKILASKNKVMIGGNILFISEPMSAPINIFGDYNRLVHDEYDVLNRILSVFAKHNATKRLIIRFHPSENGDKYDDIISKYKGLVSIIKSRNSALLSDLASTDMVIGMGSMALVAAHICRKKVVSIISDRGVKCALPFEGIVKLHNFVALEKELRKEVKTRII